MIFWAIPLLSAIAYQPLSDQDFDTKSGDINVNGHAVEYSINLQDGFSHDWTLEKLDSSSEIIFEYAKEKGYRTLSCRSNKSLDIYTTDMQTLNDRERFNKFSKSETNRVLWALFDQVPEDKTTSVIVLTDHKQHNEVLVAHEVAHYWSHRLCWDIYHPDADEEGIALEFEKFYMENK